MRYIGRPADEGVLPSSPFDNVHVIWPLKKRKRFNDHGVLPLEYAIQDLKPRKEDLNVGLWLLKPFLATITIPEATYLNRTLPPQCKQSEVGDLPHRIRRPSHSWEEEEICLSSPLLYLSP
jgi:hypothetical protein